MPARSSYDRTVWDQKCACEVLHIRRRGYFDVKAFLATASLTTLTRHLADEGGAAQFMGWKNENDVISASWHKDILSPCGVFSIQLKRRRYHYVETVKPGDLLVVYMDNAKDYSAGQLFTGKLITIAIVDRVTENTMTTGEGATTVVYTITGRDFGSIPMETSTVFDPSFAQIEQALFTQAFQERLYGKQVAAQSPVENVLNILDLFYNVRASGSQLVAAQWQFQNKLTNAVSLLSLLDITTFAQVPMFGYALVDSISPTQAGNVWALLDTYANRVVNELFIDVRDYTTQERNFLEHQSNTASAFLSDDDANTQRAASAAIQSSGVFRSASTEWFTPSDDAAAAEQVLALVHRQTPYDLDAFMRLPQIDVYPTEVYDAELGYSGHDVVNYFRIRTPILPTEFQEATYGIQVNINSVFKFGIRRMEPETMYFFASSSASGAYNAGETRVEDFADLFDYYIGLLSTWYASNDTMLAGQATIRFRPDIRIGMRLRMHKQRPLTGDGINAIDFYVQSVAHSYTVEPGGSRTTVTLVRGIRPGSKGLEANLRWTRNGPALPPSLSTLMRFTAFGAQMVAADGETIVSDQTFGGPATTPGDQ